MRCAQRFPILWAVVFEEVPGSSLTKLRGLMAGEAAAVDVQSAARRWADTWQRAWPAKQSEQIAALYRPTASYRSSPFGQPEAGGALGYVERQFAVEQAVECRFAEPIGDGDRAAVEWWADLIEGGQAITLAGVTVLRFDAEGLVVDHVDYWMQSQGVPYASWGA
jgi:hypothetical protein